MKYFYLVCLSYYSQVYKAPVGCELCGLFGPVTASQKQMYFLVKHATRKANEAADEPRENQMIVMSEQMERLLSVQRIVLPERSTKINATFANFNENLFCTIWGFSSIYEYMAAKGSSDSPYIVPPRAHAMPTKVYAICSLEVSGEWRLAASLLDNTVALFGMENARLNFLMRLEKTARYAPLYLAPISTHNALLLFNGKSAAGGKWNTSIDLYVPDQKGQFGAPRTIYCSDRGIFQFCAPLIFRNSSDSRLHAVMFDTNSESLHVFDFC